MGVWQTVSHLQQFSQPMSNLYRLADQKARRRIVSFERRELTRMLNLYSMRVASGEWRDYAIDFRPGMAIFSIFRHTAEQPVFGLVNNLRKASANDFDVIGNRPGRWRGAAAAGTNRCGAWGWLCGDQRGAGDGMGGRSS